MSQSPLPPVHVTVRAGDPTTADLIKAGIVTGDQVDAAVAAILANSRTGRFALAEGLYLDLAVVVRGSKQARWVLNDATATEGLRRGTFRKMILMARPAKA